MLVVILAAITLALATGCGFSGSVTPVVIGGSVQGGHRPVTGASIQLYAAGSGGVGSASLPLLSETVATDINGDFSIPAQYGCPSPSAEIYVIAHGGDPNVSGGKNSSLMLTALLGPCSGLAKLGKVAVNEVTTVGSIWPLAQYWKSPTHFGSKPNDSAFFDAASTVPEFINLSQGSSPGTPTPASYFAQNSKLYSLADALASCVNSSGGKAGDGSPCGQLFAMASTATSTPNDTVTAAVQIAQQPDSNVSGIFNLVTGSTPFQPSLTAAPSDWTLKLTYVVATPTISLAAGTYAGTQEVTITDATTGSVIYYTADGTNPTTSSNLYTGPISISVSSTLKAIASLSGSASAVASSAYTITGGLPPAKLAFLQQPSNGLIGTIISPAVQVVVEDAKGNPDTSASNPITVALAGGTGLGGTLTVTPQNGVATFSDLIVSVAGAGYTLSATSPSLTSATSATFSISPSSPGPVLTPAKLVFLQQPSNGVTGNPITPAVQVAVEDASGNIVTTAITPVTVTLTSSKGIGSTLWTALPQNGIATFSNVTVGATGTGYTLFATSPLLASATSAPFTISAPGGGPAPSPFKLAFLQQPMNALTQATITPAVQVVVEDSSGNAVQGANNPITLLLSGGSGLNGTLTVTPQNGVASFNDLSVSNAGTYTLQAMSSGLEPATSASFTITKPSSGNGGAVQLAFVQQPSNAQTGATISPAVRVEVQDSQGNVVTNAASPVTLSLAGGTGLGGTLTVNPKKGVATFSNLSVSAAATGLTLTATSANLLPATSTPFNISAPNPPSSPVKLAFLQQPSNALTGATLTPAVQVVVEDANGNPVPAATNPISLTLAGGTGLGGTLTVTPQNGVATFSDLSVSAAATGLTLVAASPNLTSATSVAFTINTPSSGPPPTPTRLAYIRQPSNAVTGTAISPAVQVAVEDASGNVLPTATNPITVALVGGTGLTGTLTVIPQNGIATFSDLKVSNAGTGYTLAATSPNLSSATSSSFTITAPGGGGSPSPAKLAFSVQPTNALTGAAITPAVRLAVQDSNGNVVTNATNPVTLALTTGSGLSGTLTVTPQNGVATFSDLSLSAAGNYTLSATSLGLTSATSSSFIITAPGGGNPTPATLAFLQQPSNALTGATISPAVQVAVEDSNGNIVATATNPVTLTLVGGTGLGGTLTVAPQNGIATFSDLTVSNAGSGYTLSATSPSLTSAASTSFTITAPGGGGGPSAVKLAFSVQPTNALTGTTIKPAVQVVVEDSSGKVVTNATNPVTLALTGGGSLAGTLTATPQNGIATFNDLSVSTAGTFTLSATSTGLTSATSTSFTITLGGGGPTAAKLAFLVQPSHALTGATITPAVQVVIEDTNGNPVTNATNSVTLALSTGTGLGGTLTVTPQNGVATFSDLSLSNAGTYTLSASSPSLTSATSAGFTISAPAPVAVKLAFSVQPSNAQTGSTLTPAIQVLVEDSSGNVVTNAANPVTVALVGGTGLAGTLTVTPQNGVATFSNLSVSNAGSYALSASSPALASAASTGFTITAPVLPVAVKLAFSVQPSNAQTAATIAPAVQVLVEDSSGNVVTNAANPVTVALVGGTGLTGTLTVTPQNGVAAFSNLSVSNAGSYTLSATSPALASATSTGFTITTPSLPAVKLAFSVQPSNALTGATITPAVQVALQDTNGNVVKTATNPVTLALVGGAGLGGTLTVTPQNGIATFSNLSVSNAGSYTLSATSSGLASAASTGFTISASSSSGKTYYLSPSGSDSNNGLSASSPWLTPKHSLNCGDTVIAASGTYSASNFNVGKWGTVSCPAGNNVAWLQCATFDTCKISSTSSDGMWVDASYWGVQGWEITTSSNIYAACFHAGPSGGSTIHHIIFANNVANGCMGGGFNAYDRSTTASVDYIVYIGNIAYNAAQGTGACYSGLNIYQPIASDTNPGTHMFIAGNFAYDNVDASPCNGGLTTDGEGINLDTFDFSQGGGPAYTQQAVVENNISLSNGSSGILIENNKTGSSQAHVYFKYNTTYGNMKATNRSFCVGLGEIYAEAAGNVTATNNLAVTNAAAGCQGDPIYAAAVADSNATDTFAANWLYSAAGYNMFSNNNGPFAFGAQAVGTNPAFASTSLPGAPSCSGAANVTGCMAGVIANFTPTVAAAKAYGYQPPSSASVSDPLFPQWLCTVDLPPGLVTKGCQ